MLSLSRFSGERVRIRIEVNGTPVVVWVRVHEIDRRYKRGRVRLSFDAPQEVEILREEVIGKPRKEKSSGPRPPEVQALPESPRADELRGNPGEEWDVQNLFPDSDGPD